ncbi:hypothetical protein [Chitinophaga sp. YIM B06452]|uniref:hypothetical protein n=1 Tax=Chitinophaga sp. YIM B06452 TaxID=3082158 RepID=UPI0031FF053C
MEQHLSRTGSGYLPKKTCHRKPKPETDGPPLTLEEFLEIQCQAIDWEQTRLLLKREFPYNDRKEWKD